MIEIDHTQSEIDPGERRANTLDSDSQALLDVLTEAGAPDLTHLSPEQARTLLGNLFKPDVDPEPGAEVDERKLRAYARDNPLRINDPDPDQALPAVVYNGFQEVAEYVDDWIDRTLIDQQPTQTEDA